MKKKFLISLITLISITACIGLNNKLLEEQYNVSKDTNTTDNIQIVDKTESKTVIDIKKDDKVNLGPVIKVKLSYSPNSKIINKGDISYINGKPYHGKIYVSKGNVINEVPLEQYLYSVISSEVSYKFPEEALKTQAVISRTYALFSLKIPRSTEYNLYDDYRSQVYSGISKEQKQTTKAVDDTRGEIITYKDHNPILAMFFSSIGANTLNSKDVFGRDYPYLRSVSDTTINVKWSKKIRLSTFYAKLGIKKAYHIKQRGYNVYVGNKVFNTNKLRNIFGASYIRSNNFTVSVKGSYVIFSGYGYGHGVGLSQFGAKNMADKGFKYKDIIKHYYRGVSIWKKY